MKISLVASEAVPFVKTGGLADVISALSNALSSFKHNVSVFIPYYSIYMESNLYEVIKADLILDQEKFSVLKCKNKQNVEFYFIKNDKYFGREHLYGDVNGDYIDNAERFIFFSQAVLLAMKAFNIKPDIIHSNDWQAGLVPVYLRVNYSKDEFFKNTKTIFTIHNIEYQGIFKKDVMRIANLPWREFTMHKLEYFDNLNCLKAGMVYSDIVTTVSKKYAEEIRLNSWLTKGLNSVLKLVDLRGIVNGIDYDIWNPEKDDKIVKNFSVNDLKNKSLCKEDLLKICEISYNNAGPVLAIVSRFVRAKGFELIRATLEDVLDFHEDIRLVILGTGVLEYERFFEYLKIKYRGRVSINIKFDAELAHKIYAGSDIFLMPSQVEACGLSQMISFRYGVVPVVNPVGGLFDTVIDYNERQKTGSGFVIKEYSRQGLYFAIRRALDMYAHKINWNKLVKSNMKLDFSWKNSAKEYINIYEDLL